MRFDASNGNQLSTLNLTFDNTFSRAYFPTNGVLVDADGQVLVHNMAASNANKLTVGIVNLSNGQVTTYFSQTADPNIRIDHIDVYGTVSNSGTYYVLAANGSNAIRWKVTNGNVTRESMSINAIGAAGRVVFTGRPDRFYVTGTESVPKLYSWGNSTPSATLFGDKFCGGMAYFTHDGYSFMAIATHDNTKGAKWTICSGVDFTASGSRSEHWVVPTQGMGNSDHHWSASGGSGDPTMPVSVLQRDSYEDGVHTLNNAASAQNTRLFVYSSGDGLAAYSMTRRIVTGVEDVVSDGADADDSETEYYNLQGIRVHQPLAPGIYIRRQGNVVTKVTR